MADSNNLKTFYIDITSMDWYSSSYVISYLGCSVPPVQGDRHFARATVQKKKLFFFLVSFIHVNCFVLLYVIDLNNPLSFFVLESSTRDVAVQVEVLK